MLVKIGRQITQPNPRAFTPNAMLENIAVRWLERRDPLLGTTQLFGGCGLGREEIERRHANPACNEVAQRLLVLFVTVPGTRQRAVMGKLGQRIGIMGP